MTDPKLSLEIHTDLARRIPTAFLPTEIQRAGFTRAGVGVAGGLDSSVACYLAAEALGPENVLAVRMPYKTSSPESLEHAHLVVDATGVEEATIPITEMGEAHFARFPGAEAVRRGDGRARARA